MDKATVLHAGSSLGTQHSRLEAARRITSAGIPCILWAEDALSFAHDVSTFLFDLQLLVPEDQIAAAARILEQEMSYSRVNEYPFPFIDSETNRNAYSAAIRLEHPDGIEQDYTTPPRFVCLLPQSYFHLDARQASRFQSLVPPLDPSNDRILVPRYRTFLEALVDGAMEPACGYRNTSATRRLLVYIGYLVTYRMKVEPDFDWKEGELAPGHVAILAEMDGEYRWFLDALFRGGHPTYTKSLEWRKLRVEESSILTSPANEPQIGYVKGRATDLGLRRFSTSSFPLACKSSNERAEQEASPGIGKRSVLNPARSKYSSALTASLSHRGRPIFALSRRLLSRH